MQKAVSSKSHWLVLSAFWACLLFQQTELRYVWNIPVMGTLANFSYLAFSGILLVWALAQSYPARVWLFYIIPCLLLVISMSLNITFNTVLVPANFAFFGLVIPWLVSCLIPLFLRKNWLNAEQLWKHYYYFILIGVLLCLLEYALVYFGYYLPRAQDLPYGAFLIGKFTLFHRLGDGTAHERFYGFYAEPGTLAMWLLPAMMYALLYRKFIGLIFLGAAFFFTYSLGGVFGLLMMVLLIPFYTLSRRNIIIAIFATAVLSITAFSLFKDNLSEQYEEKNESRTIREDNVTNMLENLGEAMVTYPFGYPLAIKTAKAENNKLYFGSNFLPGYMLVIGGIVAMFMYSSFLLVCLASSVVYIFKRDKNKTDILAFITIVVSFPFIFQRFTMWESALFSFLIAPSVIKILANKNVTECKNEPSYLPAEKVPA
jgi:hypothetical protein